MVAAIREFTGGGATHAIDTSAKGAVINQAIAALAPLGTLALVGIRVPDFAMDVQAVMSGGKTVRGVIEVTRRRTSSSRAWWRCTRRAGSRWRSSSADTTSKTSTPRSWTLPVGSRSSPSWRFDLNSC